MHPRLSLISVILAAAWAPGPAAAAEIVVFAAASLKTALDPLAEAFGDETGNNVTISYAGSNTLAQQILQGAPADVFISASQQWMDEVEKRGGLAPGTRHDLLGNRLVLVAHDPAPAVELGPDTDLKAMLGDGWLAMGMVDSVPAGQYGKAALLSLGQWDTVQASVAQTDNVRAALALVSTGEAPLGIVYASDAVAEPKVHVVAAFPEGSHDPITYPAALTSWASDPADRQFLDFLGGEAAAKVFGEQGFIVLE